MDLCTLKPTVLAPLGPASCSCRGRGATRVEASEVTYNACVSACGGAGRWQCALLLLNEMQLIGSTVNAWLEDDPSYQAEHRVLQCLNLGMYRGLTVAACLIASQLALRVPGHSDLSDLAMSMEYVRCVPHTTCTSL